MRGIVPEAIRTKHELFSALRDHAECGPAEAVDAFGRPRTAAEVEPRLRLDRRVARHRPRNPVRELLLVGPHATGLSFSGSVDHFSHQIYLRRQTPPRWRIFGGLYKNLRGLSIATSRIPTHKFGEQGEMRPEPGRQAWTLLQNSRRSHVAPAA